MKMMCKCGQPIEFPAEMNGQQAACPACGQDIQLLAPAKPGFVARRILASRQSNWRICTCCGHYGPTAKRPGGSAAVEVLLWICFIIPGVIYTIWRSSNPEYSCSSCGNKVTVKVNSPKGRELMAQYHSDANETDTVTKTEVFAWWLKTAILSFGILIFGVPTLIFFIMAMTKF